MGQGSDGEGGRRDCTPEPPRGMLGTVSLHVSTFQLAGRQRTVPAVTATKGQTE
jgi:hypothetical protein